MDSAGMLTLGSMILGFIVWLVRLEGRVNYQKTEGERTQKELDSLVIRHESLDCELVKELGRVRESLARIEGRLGLNE
jgi:hypothetical protein